MANVVIIKFRSYLPGGGHDRSGGQRQGKTSVRGRIEVTSLQGAGEALPPEDVGLTKIDHIDLELEEPVASDAADLRIAAYSFSAQQFYVLQEDAGGSFNAGVAGLTGGNMNLTFDAFGDSAHDVELL